ncbi:hypothetical protein ACP70R_028203 [Stipagrostis hirtigluma subsp. patula]
MQALYDNVGMEVPAEIAAIQVMQANLCAQPTEQGD